MGIDSSTFAYFHLVLLCFALGLALGYRVMVTVRWGRTTHDTPRYTGFVGEGRVIPRDVGYLLSGLCFTQQFRVISGLAGGMRSTECRSR